MQWPNTERGPKTARPARRRRHSSAPPETMRRRARFRPCFRWRGSGRRVRKFARQCARGLQLRLRRGHREARGDRVIEAAAAAPALDQRLALVVAALGGVPQRFWRVAVHHHLAGDHSRAAPFGRGEECVDRLRVHRAIDHRRRRARAEQLVEKERGDARAMRGIARISAPRRTYNCAASRAAVRRRSRSPGSADNGHGRR